LLLFLIRLKYFVADANKSWIHWEDGSDRVVDLSKLPTTDGIYHLVDDWQVTS
jgi:hypothetical protein